MSSGVSNPPSAAFAAKARRAGLLGPCLLLGLHGLAAILMATTEVGLLGVLVFLLVWIMLNCLWLALVRRPAVAALLSLEILALLTLLSRFKFDKLWMTIDFVDVMIADRDTVAFLLAIFPSLRWWALLAALATIALIAFLWRRDRSRVSHTASVAGFLVSFVALIAVSLLWPTGLAEDFEAKSYVSKFARSGVEAVHELATRGYLEASDAAGETPKDVANVACHPARKLPNIILLHDESSFDITVAPGIKVPSGYRDHFRSFDGKARKFVVEGVGGPSWYTEYNVLTGLSVRSFGRFATSVTRIAAGHVYRGLPRALDLCGYRTFSLYPFYGAFLGSRAFQTTTGIQHYLDMRDLGTRDFEADSFYFDRALDLIGRERGNGPLFLYVYTVANHFPWDKRLRPELTPNWHDPGNRPDVDEYIRRQGMSARDYQELLKDLARRFPGEPFLIVRYGDHQPQFGAGLIDPSLGKDGLAKRAEASDPRYRTTYYAIDAVNFTPANVTSALDTIDAPYLPLVLLEAAGVPLERDFASQKAMLGRCGGVFYRCEDGAPARQLNRLLIDAGLIKGL
jgi:phosphoglycerol transferase MdoB-like AlkP superfamily enzyme